MKALKACRVLGATLIFAGQIVGSREITNASYDQLLNAKLYVDVSKTNPGFETRRDSMESCEQLYQRHEAADSTALTGSLTSSPETGFWV